MLLRRSAVLAASALIGAWCGSASAGPTSLFVSSGTSNNVLEYNGATGAFRRVFASGGGLVEPEGVLFGPDGNLYVSSRPAQVLKYNGKTGAFMGVFASGHGLQDPAGIQFGGPNNDLYVSSGIPDPPATGGNQILRFDGRTGAFKAVLDPNNAAGLDDPEGMRIGRDGLLYVLSTPETGPGEVLRYDPATNQFKDRFIGKTGPGAVEDPTDLQFTANGDLLVSSAATSVVKEYDTTGAFKETFIHGGSGGLHEAEGLTFTPRGNLLVASELGNAVLAFNGTTGAPIGQFVRSNSGGLGEPTFMIFGPASSAIPLPAAAWTGLITIAGLLAARTWARRGALAERAC
jgi:streptogramin lyase